MPKDQKDFFDEPQPWSRIKNSLLETYLIPYFSKISMTRRKTFYVDCSAGQGCFKDGSDGSPFLAIRARTKALEPKQGGYGEIELAFIEKEHSGILRKNVANAFPGMPAPRIVDGCFEKDLLPLIAGHRGENLFLYIDPFGIKSLQYGIFKALAECGMFASIEILMNFNTFGFIRVARSILAQKELISARWDSDGFLEKTDAVREGGLRMGALKTPEALTEVAHGDYWIDIIRKYADVPQGFKEAEKELASAYRGQLTKLFKYVLKMPIGKKDGSIPEYCMYFMTEHPEGCLLMVDNMMKRSEDLRTDVQQRGQRTFALDVENEFVDSERICSDFRAFVKKGFMDGAFPQRIPVNVLKACFFAEYGVVCKSSVLNKACQEMEEKGQIHVDRNPRHPDGGGKVAKRASRSFDTKHFDVRISWR